MGDRRKKLLCRTTETFGWQDREGTHGKAGRARQSRAVQGKAGQGKGPARHGKRAGNGKRATRAQNHAQKHSQDKTLL